MKIVIKKRKKVRFWFSVPTVFVFNRLTAFTVRKALKKNGIILQREKMTCFIKELKKYKKRHGRWDLAEISLANGIFMLMVI